MRALQFATGLLSHDMNGCRLSHGHGRAQCEEFGLQKVTNFHPMAPLLKIHHLNEPHLHFPLLVLLSV